VRDKPIVDTTVTEYMRILNSNTYQKGASVLHMLRGEIGDSAFSGGIREYYQRFRDSTALSSDLRDIMQRKAGRPLDWFFRQWLLQPGYPQVDVGWSYDAARRVVVVELNQVQPQPWGVYRLDVDLSLTTADGETFSATARFDGANRTVRVQIDGVRSRPASLRVDPTQKLLLLEVLSVSETRND
jgi:aminopeptidase N